MQSLEFLSQTVWPTIRPFVKSPKRCINCLLSERATILKSETCAECIYSVFKTPVKSPLPYSISIADYLRSRDFKTNTYDAVLMLSGGKDSTFILSKLSNWFPNLKVLSVIVDTGFLSPYALVNARNICDTYSRDLLVLSSKRRDLQKVLKEAFSKRSDCGCYGVVDFAEGEFIFNHIQDLTRSLGIPLVISGMTRTQLDLICHKPNDFVVRVGDGLEMLCPLAAWNPPEEEMLDYLKYHELMVKGSISPLASNSQLLPAMFKLDIHNLGYSSFEPEFAQLARERKINREYWVNVFDCFTWMAEKKMLDRPTEQVLGKLGLTIKDCI